MENQNILITGATGFIGANLLRSLVLSRVKDIHVFIRPDSNTWRIDDILENVNVHIVDLTDRKACAEAVRGIRPKTIFHMAIYGGYPFQDDPLTTVNTNFLGTLNLVDSLHDMNYESFISMGSSSEYGYKRSRMRERDILEPNNVYGVSKASASLYALMNASRFNKPITVVRLFSGFGPYEDKNRLIPSVINACINNEELVVKSPYSLRDYIYVGDVIDFLIKLSQKKKSFGALNLGAGKARSVLEVIKIVQKLERKKIQLKIMPNRPSPLEPNPWVADISKARRLLRWKPRVSFVNGLKMTIEWNKKWMS